MRRGDCAGGECHNRPAVPAHAGARPARAADPVSQLAPGTGPSREPRSPL